LAPAILRGDLEVGAVVEAGGAFSACLVALNLVINNFNGLSKFAAGIDRLDTFKRAMTSELVTSPGEDRIQHRVGADLRMEGVTLNVPQQERVLVKNLSLSVAPGTHLVITGPSGCGKTSLLRAIIGLWHQGRGSIVRPKLDDILFLPQRPYMVAGTLRQQLLYPRLDRKVSDAELLAMLRRVQLGHLADCDAPLDVESDWSKLLSIGEQQRLSFARVLLIRPRYAFLDEATSALDSDTEELLYRQLAKSGATMVSVSHHAALHKHHSLELELLGDGEWRLRPIRGQRAVKSIVPWTRMALVPRPNVEVHGS
jgi:putative ATP-binding cassette transporter